jgi:hypothetical protein
MYLATKIKEAYSTQMIIMTITSTSKHDGYDGTDSKRKTTKSGYA